MADPTEEPRKQPGLFVTENRATPPKTWHMLLIGAFIMGALLLTAASKWAGLQGGFLRPAILLTPPAVLLAVFAFQYIRRFIKAYAEKSTEPESSDPNPE